MPCLSCGFCCELSCGVIGLSTIRRCSIESLLSHESPAGVFACLCTGVRNNLNCGACDYECNEQLSCQSGFVLVRVQIGKIIKPGSCSRGFGAFSENHLFDTWKKTGIADRRRSLRRIRSRSESRRTSAGLDFVGYRAANARRNRSRSTNPRALPSVQNPICESRDLCSRSACSACRGSNGLRC